MAGSDAALSQFFYDIQKSGGAMKKNLLNQNCSFDASILNEKKNESDFGLTTPSLKHLQGGVSEAIRPVDMMANDGNYRELPLTNTVTLKTAPVYSEYMSTDPHRSLEQYTFTTCQQIKKGPMPKRTYLREIAGNKWKDSSLAEWPENDFRIFVGNLSKDVTDDILAQHFAHYPSFAKARVVKDKYTRGPRGYGFISFLDSTDLSRSLTEMEGTYIINRPCKLSKSNWDERTTAVLKDGKLKWRKQSVSNSHHFMVKHSNDAHLLKRSTKYKIDDIPSFISTSKEDLFGRAHFENYTRKSK